jgi:hypothetical protein
MGVIPGPTKGPLKHRNGGITRGNEVDYRCNKAVAPFTFTSPRSPRISLVRVRVLAEVDYVTDSRCSSRNNPFNHNTNARRVRYKTIAVIYKIECPKEGKFEGAKLEEG